MKLKDNYQLYLAELDRQLKAFKSGKDTADDKIRPKRRRHIEAEFHNHILPFFGDVDIDKIDGRLINEFQDNLKSDLKAPTVKGVVQSVFRMLKFFYRKRLIDFIPNREEIDKLNRQEARQLPTPSYEDVQRTLLHCHKIEHEVMVRFGSETGMRISEILALSWGAVKRGVVDVKLSAVDRELMPTKTKDSTRKVKLSDRLKAKLAQMKLGATNSSDEDFLFINSAGRLYTNTGAARNILWPAQKRAGVEHFGWHGLRRFYINHLLDSGVIEHHVQKLVGHTIGSDTTSKHYRRINTVDVLVDDYVVEVG
jgi:integrase